jgi:hypothetical protein
MKEYSLKNDELSSGREQTNPIVHRVNEHSYIVAFDNQQQKSIFYSEKSTLTDIYTELIRSKENLLTNKGFIRVKEYTIDAYECRCHEHNNHLTDEKINDHKHLFNHKLEF